MLPDWLRPYIEIPFKDKGRRWDGADCWGGVRLMLYHRFHISLPSYLEEYATTDDRIEIERIFEKIAPIHSRQVSLLDARVGDVLILRVEGVPWHCGVIVAPGRFFHVMRGIGACVDDYTRAHWAKRVISVHRHPALDEVVHA